MKNIHLRFEAPIYAPVCSSLKDTYTIDGKEIEVCTNVRDVSLFFDQSRIEKLGYQNVRDIFSMLDAKVEKSPTENISDEELCKYIKPRYCTSRADIRNFSEYIMREQDKLNDEIKQRRKDKAATAAQKRVTEFIDALLNKSKSS